MDYRKIADALDFYQDRGYVYMDAAPWHVFHGAYYATKPPGATDTVMLEIAHRQASVDLGDPGLQYLVASGEQSFIQMMVDGMMELKRAICVTPCFRAEKQVDALHQRYFMKAELINAHDVDEGHLVHMVHEAASFFEQYLPVRVVKTSRSDLGEPTYDIVEKSTRFELGSYGIREVTIQGRSFRWVYGTACAEPRLSTAIQKHSRHAGR